VETLPPENRGWPHGPGDSSGPSGCHTAADAGPGFPDRKTQQQERRILTQNAAKLKAICEDKAVLAVLFISSPKNGDRFEFGTLEELENEKEALENDNEGDDELCVQITDTRNLLNWLDFEAYEGNQPVLEL
jgi:hypothetical protein